MQRPPSDARRHLLVMVTLVIAVGAVAIGVHELAGLRDAGRSTRALFAGAWTLANLLIVATGLYRIRLARAAGRGRGR